MYFLAATVKCHIYLFICLFIHIILFFLHFNRYFERSTHIRLFPLSFYHFSSPFMSRIIIG